MRSLFRRNKPKRKDGGNGTITSSPRNTRQQLHSRPPNDSASDMRYRKPTSRTEIDESDGDMEHPYDMEHPPPSPEPSSGRTVPEPLILKQHHPYPPQEPKKEAAKATESPRRGKKKQPKDGAPQSVLASLLKGDWLAAASMLDAQPELAKQPEEVILHGQRTVALPLLVACCLQTPPEVFGRLINLYPEATQQPDDACGRLPLHWACISNAPIQALEMLIETFPNACKARDKSQDRTPLHYMAIHASNVAQLEVLFRSNLKRVMRHKDKDRKTPLELARASNNPIKAEIVVTLLHQQEVLSKQQQRGADGSSQSTHWTFQQSSNAAVCSTSPQRSPRYKARAFQLTPGAQAAAFADEEFPATASSASRPPSKKSLPTYRYRGPLPGLKPGDDGTDKPMVPPLVAAAGGRDGSQSMDQRRTKDPTRSAPDLAGHSPRQHEHRSESHASKPAAATSSPPNEISVEEDEYYAKYMRKMSAEKSGASFFANAKGKSDQQDHHNDHHHDDDQSIDPESLMDGMKSNMDQLQQSLTGLQSELDEKDTQLMNLEATTAEMVLRERDLERGLKNARSVVEHQHVQLDRKRERIKDLKEQMAVLRAELLEEQSTLEPMEQSVLGLEQKILDKEQKLRAHREEKDSFELMKLSLQEEKEILNREVNNSHSELKSLKAIQDLAMGEDNL